jgi:hypothetical protein
MKIGDRVFVRGYIDEIRKDTVIIRNAGGYFGTIPSEVITGELPSAQPERKKGEWIDKSGGIEGAWNYCSVCGEQAIDLYDFCPNCGADMRGKLDG